MNVGLGGALLALAAGAWWLLLLQSGGMSIVARPANNQGDMVPTRLPPSNTTKRRLKMTVLAA